MNVSIIAHTTPVVKSGDNYAPSFGSEHEACAIAAAICTDSKNPERALKGALSCGHESVLEHMSITFLIEGISRVTLAQLTRHRIASFSVQSQRYCEMREIETTVPEAISNSVYWRNEVEKLNLLMFAAYTGMIADGIAAEDARYILPEATCTKLVMTMNARELRHFFSLRACNRAQLEIRELADKMIEECRKIDGEIFDNMGAPCQMGKPCPEGKMTCGHPRISNNAN